MRVVVKEVISNVVISVSSWSDDFNIGNVVNLIDVSEFVSYGVVTKVDGSIVLLVVELELITSVDLKILKSHVKIASNV